MSLSSARAGLTDLDERIIALEADIGRCACLDSAKLDEWASWRNDAHAYVAISRDRLAGVENALNAATLGGPIALGAAETYSDHEASGVEHRTEGWAAELGTWQQQVAAKGGALTAPGAPPGWSLPWTTIGVLAALVVVGVGVSVYAVRKLNAPVPREVST